MMEEKSTESLVDDLSTLFRYGATASLTDGQLLDRFVAGGDAAETAFEGIVRRHGPMVLGVCRRTLGDVHAAEDAFQATFLVLTFRARAINRRDSLGPWLHGVAFRLACRSRGLVRRREAKFSPLPDLISPETMFGDTADLRPVLDEELSRLPEKYRRPVVLCYLEGLTQEQAARELGWTKGTVSGRLARAKDLLRGRLTRRGLAPAAGLLGAGAGTVSEAAARAVPPSLIDATTRAAVAVVLGAAESGAVSGAVLSLARAVQRSMLVGRFKAATILLMLGALGSAVAIGYAGPEDRPIAPGGAGTAAVRPVDSTLPQGARVRMGTALLRHERLVDQVMFSPDGRTLASAGGDGAVRFWDPRTGEAVPGLDPPKESAPPHVVDYSSDGQLLVVGYRNGTVQLWDVAARRVLFRSQVHRGQVEGIAFAPDGLTFASASSEDSCVRLWDVATGTERRALELGDEEKIRGPVTFSPDGNRLAMGTVSHVGEREVTIRIWDLRGGGDQVMIQGAHGSQLAGLAFTSDGKALISGGHERRPDRPHLACWEVSNGRQLWDRELVDTLYLGGFAVTENGATLVSAHHDQLLVWDVPSGRVTRTIPIPPDEIGGGATGVAISPDDRTIAMLRNDHEIRLLDIDTGQPLSAQAQSHKASVLSVAFAPDGRTLATSGADGRVRIWDGANGAPRGHFKISPGGYAWAVAVSPDGRTLAAAGENSKAGTHYYGGVVRLWDLAKGRVRREFKLDHRATLVSFSPDGRRMAVATWNTEATLGLKGKHDGLPDDTVRVFDADTGQQLAELRGHGGFAEKIIAFAFSPDGRSIVTANQDLVFRFWDLDSGKETRQLAITGYDGTDKRVRLASAAFSPDLKWAVTSATRDDRLIVWDLTSGVAQRTIRNDGSRGSHLAISPDGRSFCSVYYLPRAAAVGDARLRLWDLASGRRLLSLATGNKRVASLAFAPDGLSLATGMADTTAIVWDLGRLVPPEPDRPPGLSQPPQ